MKWLTNPARTMVATREISDGMVRNYHDRTSKIAKKLLRVRVFLFFRKFVLGNDKIWGKKNTPVRGRLSIFWMEFWVGVEPGCFRLLVV